MNARAVGACLLVAGAAACQRNARAPVVATGTLEYVEVEVSPLSPGRIVRLYPHEGDHVLVGDTLVRLVQTTVHSDIEGAEARLASANAQLRDLTAGPRPAEVARAEADVAAAAADADRAQRDVDRLAPLAAKQDISRQQFDEAQTAARTAAARRDALSETLRVVREGTRPDQITAARHAVESAQAALDAARQAAADLILTSTVTGTVVSRNAEPGEVLAPGASALTLADVARPYVRIYVDERVVPLVHIGQPLSATLDAFPGKHFTGTVTAVNTKAEYTPRVALTREERADLLFGVRIDFADTTGMLKAGVPVTVQLPGGANP